MDRFTVECYEDDDRRTEWSVVEWTHDGDGYYTGKTIEKFRCEADAAEHLYCLRMEHAFGGSGYVNL